MKIGYARVSTQAQNLDRQLVALKAEGCDLIYEEKASGKDVQNRPQLAKAISALQEDDVVIPPFLMGFSRRIYADAVKRNEALRRLGWSDLIN
ncbi:recombinase family protein [uncultured Cohaesibacter sp.]|uniref:recombinase family protein n=1 Tax=uncultured Cohaesibacter sp. TaxID=1002546 RepID=UPI0029305D2C|nr:recombinase family protein [uncultured Cohaesibacter sp.]